MNLSISLQGDFSETTVIRNFDFFTLYIDYCLERVYSFIQHSIIPAVYNEYYPITF